jgi:hypothetical protein
VTLAQLIDELRKLPKEALQRPVFLFWRGGAGDVHDVRMEGQGAGRVVVIDATQKDPGPVRTK